MIYTSGNPNIRIARLTGDSSTSSTSMSEVTGLSIIAEPGTYIFEYYIRGQSATATVTHKFAVDHTGTTTMFMYSLQFPSAGVTAATGVVDQELNATTGHVWAQQSTRVKNTTLGPMTDVDTINADIMYRITGMMLVTVSGTLRLMQGSETATSTTVKAESALILFKVG